MIFTMQLFSPKAGGCFDSINDITSIGDFEIEGMVGDGLSLTLKTDGFHNFGIKTQNTPYIYEKFNGTDGQTVFSYDPTWIKYSGDGALISATHPRYPGSKSAYNDYTRYGFSTNYKDIPNTKKLRMSYWVYGDLPAPGTSGQIKLCRITSSEVGRYNGHGTFYVSSWHPNVDDTALVTIDSGTGTGGADFGANYLKVIRNQWFKIDCFYDHSDPGVPNGSYVVSMNNGESVQGRYNNVQTRDVGNNYLGNSAIIGTMLANENADFPMKIHIGDMVVDQGWSRVVICNTPVITPTSIVEDQNYTSWSSNQIVITQCFGAIPTNSPKYLKIFNDDNQEIISTLL